MSGKGSKDNRSPDWKKRRENFEKIDWATEHKNHDQRNRENN